MSQCATIRSCSQKRLNFRRIPLICHGLCSSSCKFTTSCIVRARQRTVRHQLGQFAQSSKTSNLALRRTFKSADSRRRVQFHVKHQRGPSKPGSRDVRLRAPRVAYIPTSPLSTAKVSSDTLVAQDAGKQPVRSKYVWPRDWSDSFDRKESCHPSHTSSQDLFRFDRPWTIRYHRMVENGERAPLHFSLQYSKTDLLFRRFTGPGLSIRSMHLAWIHVPRTQRLQLWQDLMLWCLQASQRRAMQLLLVTTRGNRLRPPRHIIGDCLQHLAKHYLFRVPNPDPWALNSILRLVHKYVDGGQRGRLVQSVPDQVVFLLLKHCDDQQVKGLLQRFMSHYVQLHANTLLHALERTLDMGDVTLSLSLLRHISLSGLGTDRKQVQSACVRLMRARYDVPDQFSIQTRILIEILEMGIRPNIAFYNSILLNTVEAGYVDLAVQMFDVAKANRLIPDSVTYRILFKGALQSNKLKICHRLVEEVENNATLLHDPAITGTLFHAVSRCYQPSFPAMLGLYKRHWDPRPLEELNLCQPDERPSDDRGNAVQGKWPPSRVLGQMMCAYVGLHRKSSTLFSNIYCRYHEHVQHNHPIIGPMAQSDHIGNAFVMIFGQFAKTLPHCTTVVKDMLDDSKSQRMSKKTEQVYPAASPPTVRTWSILANAYFRHGQKRAAEKVLDLMRERGIARDQVTWNAIVDSYTSLRDVEKAVDAIVGMQAAGFEMNAGTLKSLPTLGNRDKLLEAFKQTLKRSESEHDTIPGQMQKSKNANLGRERSKGRSLRARYQQLVAGQEPEASLMLAA